MLLKSNTRHLYARLKKSSFGVVGEITVVMEGGVQGSGGYRINTLLSSAFT